MTIALNDLIFAPKTVEIKGFSIRLKPFTLKLESWVLDKFGSIEKFSQELETNRSFLLDHIHILTEDFSSLNEFYSFLTQSKMDKKDFIDLGRNLHIAVCDNILKSLPISKNPKRQKEINEALGKDSGQAPSYSEYYDRIAVRYGYTLEEFSNLTRKQLKILLEETNKGSYKDLEVQASLFGRKLKPMMNYDADITPEQEKQNEEDAAKLLAEMTARYEARKLKNGK